MDLSPSARGGSLAGGDPRRRLAELLADARRSGAVFSEAWPGAVAHALAGAEADEHGGCRRRRGSLNVVLSAKSPDGSPSYV